MKGKSKILSYLFVLGLGFSVLFIHFYLPRFITEMKNPFIVLYNSKYSGTTNQPYIENEQNGKFINYTSFDGTRLQAFLTYAKTDTIKGTIILVHGIRSNKAYFYKLSKTAAKNGYNSVALDLRAHGFSKGSHCTFGVKEKKDIASLIDHLNNEEAIKDNIGIWGQSLGGAISIQALSYDKRIQFGIIESTFSNFHTITNDYARHYIGFGIPAFTKYQVNRASKIADFNPNEAYPIEACKQITQPVFMAHGAKDKRIKIEYGKQNFDQLKSTKKQFYEIPDGNHYNIWEVGGNAYFEKVFEFMDDCIRN